MNADQNVLVYTWRPEVDYEWIGGPEDGHPEPRTRQHGWDLAKSIKTTELIDALVKSFPDIVVSWFIELVAKPIILEGRIEIVEIPEAVLAH